MIHSRDMEGLKICEILEATSGRLICGNKDFEVKLISTDSRKIDVDCMFIPIMGERFDGHDFITQSFEKGAKCCLTQKEISCPDDKIVIKVDDTLTAFQDIAKYYRRKFNIPFVAVTGSVGKTTTKEMIACVLEQKYKVLKTEGNFNNQIGLPLMLLKLDSSYQIGVLEMGMSGFGEIERLSEIINPNTAVITSIGVSHIEKLGSQANILKAKLEILKGMQPSDNLIINADDKMLSNIKDIHVNNIFNYSINSKRGLYPFRIESSDESGSKYSVIINKNEEYFTIPIPGEHNIYNSLAAIQVGLIYNVPVNDIVKGLKSFVSGKMRQNIINLPNNIKIIEDCYNASPQSMKAGISVLSTLKGDRKIAVLGDMLEMGEYSAEGHNEVGSFVAQKAIDYLFLIGQYKEFTKEGAMQSCMEESKIMYFNDKEELSSYLNKFIKENDVVLIKGSRGIKMEQIVSSLCEVK